jgi:Holliday junction resolvase RusA-like endonuclease
MSLPKQSRVVLRFAVYGDPQTAGSKQAFVPLHPVTKQPYRKNGRIVVSVVDDNPKGKGWKRDVAAVARVRWGARPLLTGPLAVQMVVFKLRPKSHYGTGRNADRLKPDAPDYPDLRPDVLKLARAVEDALTQVLWHDDAQIVHEELRKEWGPRAGVEVAVATMPRVLRAERTRSLPLLIPD